MRILPRLQRGRERGVDLRQGALLLRRAEAPPPRRADGQAATASCSPPAGTRRSPRSARGSAGVAGEGRVHRRRSRRLRDHGAACASWPSGWARRMSTAARTAPGSMPARRAGYLFNTTIAGIEQADACLLVGTNPRWEAPIINARLRKRWRAGGFKVGRIGAVHPLTYPGRGAGRRHRHAGGPGARRARLSPRRCKQAKNPMLILGMGALARPDGAAVLSLPPASPSARLITRRAGTASTCCTPRPPGSAASISAWCPGEGGRDVAGILAGAAVAARSRSCS